MTWCEQAYDVIIIITGRIIEFPVSEILKDRAKS